MAHAARGTRGPRGRPRRERARDAAAAGARCRCASSSRATGARPTRRRGRGRSPRCAAPRSWPADRLDGGPQTWKDGGHAALVDRRGVARPRTRRRSWRGCPPASRVPRTQIQADLAAPQARLRPRRAHEVRAGRARPSPAASRTASRMGSPIALRIGNTEWPQVGEVMSREPGRAPEKLAEGPRRRADPRPAPRPRRPRRHAEVRLRRGPHRPRARERPRDRRPGARSAPSRAPSSAELGIRLVSHRPPSARCTCRPARPCPRRTTSSALDADPLRCFDAATTRGDGGRGRSTPTRTATPSAASSRCWPTACRWASARTCTGTAASTRGWRGPSWASRRSRASRSATASRPARVPGSPAHDEIVDRRPTASAGAADRAGGTEGGMSTGDAAAGARRR